MKNYICSDKLFCPYCRRTFSIDGYRRYCGYDWMTGNCPCCGKHFGKKTLFYLNLIESLYIMDEIKDAFSIVMPSGKAIIKAIISIGMFIGLLSLIVYSNPPERAHTAEVSQAQEAEYLPLWYYEEGGTLESYSISSDGSYIAVAGTIDYDLLNWWNRHKVYLFNREGMLLWDYTKRESYDDATSVSISSDGSYVAAGLDDEVYLFNREGMLLWSYKYTAGDNVRSVSISSDGSYVAAGYYDELYLFNRDGMLLWDYKVEEARGLSNVRISSDGSYVATESQWDKSEVYLFNREGMLLQDYKMENSAAIFTSDRISSDGSYVAAGLDENKVYLFNREGMVLWDYKIESTGEWNWNIASDVRISSDGSYIAAKTKYRERERINRRASKEVRYDRVYFFGNIQKTASGAILNAKQSIASDKSKGFNVAETEALLSQAEQAFKTKNYTIAYELAKIAVDVDKDGIPNYADFAPKINNSDISFVALILLIIVVWRWWSSQTE